MAAGSFDLHAPAAVLARPAHRRERALLGVILVVALASCKGDCSRDAPPTSDTAHVASAAPAAPGDAAATAVAPAASAPEASPDARAAAEVSPDAAVQAPRAAAGSASPGIKAACPKVSVPSEGRFAACKAQGGTLTGIETDGCIRGYDCVKPPGAR